MKSFFHRLWVGEVGPYLGDEGLLWNVLILVPKLVFLLLVDSCFIALVRTFHLRGFGPRDQVLSGFG